jgi:hypothetical protein
MERDQRCSEELRWQMGERRHHQLLGSTTLLNPQKALTSKNKLITKNHDNLPLATKRLHCDRTIVLFFSMTLLSFWLFVFCALFIAQTLKRIFSTSFSIAKRRRKVWAALVRAALVCGLACGIKTFEVFCWCWEAVIKKEGF